ncbi:hypothetical protein O3M35_005233 [Rhynocoris fuscipes]|uniref:Uncharacterized protein n=1 Tax=Rhynocoris fuscipes TaxID=488301 RepID=A0AAW1DL85_9HEMI
MEGEVGKVSLKELISQISKLIDSKELLKKGDLEPFLSMKLEEMKTENVQLKNEIQNLKESLKMKERQLEILENYVKRKNSLVRSVKKIDDNETQDNIKFNKDVDNTVKSACNGSPAVSIPIVVTSL